MNNDDPIPEGLPNESEFSVYQFFADGTYEKVVSFVGPEKAMQTVTALANSIGAKLGTTKRIIMTDGGDCINWEWKFGEGITFPLSEKTEEAMTLLDVREKIRKALETAGIHVTGSGMSPAEPPMASIDIEIDGLNYEIRINEFETGYID